jgi:multisubunit Na+/H+ antiporter MnhG subunit
MNIKLNWDGMGIVTSVLCAIHCGLLPLLLPALPLFGINIIHNSTFEWGMIALAFLVGMYSLYHGFKKHHHSYQPVIIFSIGFVFLIAKQFAAYEFVLLAIAVLLIITAHINNYRLCTKNKCNSPHHKH